jgi:hypothetical protein
MQLLKWMTTAIVIALGMSPTNAQQSTQIVELPMGSQKFIFQIHLEVVRDQWALAASRPFELAISADANVLGPVTAQIAMTKDLDSRAKELEAMLEARIALLEQTMQKLNTLQTQALGDLSAEILRLISALPMDFVRDESAYALLLEKLRRDLKPDGSTAPRQ